MIRWILLVLLVLGLAVARSSVFIVSEGEQALITQFGQIRGEPLTKAGLAFKLPFIQDVRRFEKRILRWDGDVINQIPTKDKKYIYVDTTARWRIADLRRFAERVVTERGARDRLNDILDGVTRDVISNHNLVEAVRNSNAIIQAIQERTQEADEAETTIDPVAAAMAEEISLDIEPVKLGREKLSRLIVEGASEELSKLGIELIDVQLRSIAYEQSVEAKVYDRMISERERIAEKIRAIGKGEQAKIEGKLNRDLKEIESEAYRKSQAIRGEAEAEAIEVYAQALGQDPQYFRFIKTLETYRKALPGKASLLLSTDSHLLSLINSGPHPQTSGQAATSAQ